MFIQTRRRMAPTESILLKHRSLPALQPQILMTQTRTITSHKLILDVAPRQEQLKEILDLYGSIDGQLGIVRMNREHRHNQLTNNMIEQIQRGVQTMDEDAIVNMIYLGTHKHENFCHGTDFRSLTHMKKEDNFKAIRDYFEKLYTLQTNIAKTNKPIIAVAPGHSYNSGASLLAATSMPLMTLNSKLAFNEVTFGFVPHSGATYYLSKLPGEFGTFMALTGLPINGADAGILDITSGCVQDPTHHSDQVADILYSQIFPRFPGEKQYQLNDSAQQSTPWQQYLQTQSQFNKNTVFEDQYRQQNLQGNVDGQQKFVELKDRVPNSVGEAETKYLQTLREDAARAYSEEQLGFFDFHAQFPQETRPINYFKEQQHYVEAFITQKWPEDAGIATQHQTLIDRCFWHNSIEEIIEALRKESDPFAAKCLQAMERNSNVSMKLALKMLRRAQNLDFQQCLRMELDVAFNRMRDADFDLGVKNVLLNPKKKGSNALKKPGFAIQVNDSKLERYFESSEWSKSINVGIVENALLPTRHYYERFSDSVRLWLNEESTTRDDQRDVFALEARKGLLEFGIDVRDRALTQKTARAHMRAKLDQERVLKTFEDRSKQLMMDPILMQEYTSQIEAEVSSLEQNQDAYYKLVNNYVSEVFECAYLDKLGKIYNSSKKAHDLAKRRMFVDFKKFLFRSRVITNDKEQVRRTMDQIKNFPFQQMHLTETWDKSYREMSHPDLETSPIYHLTKAVGRLSMTPQVIAKAYLTQPDLRQQMTALTLDPAELKSIHEDILAHPQKYERLLKPKLVDTQDSGWVRKRNRDLELVKFEEAEYWYRVINDGRSPLDDWPMAREFEAYKTWVDQIETRAYDTLLACVYNALIYVRSAKQESVYAGKLQGLRSLLAQQVPKGTSPQVLEKLGEEFMPSAAFPDHYADFVKANANEDGELLSPHNPTLVESELPINKSKIGDKKRPLSDIRLGIKAALKSDALVSEIVGKESSNQLIQEFQQQLEEELFRLLEIALLNSYGVVSHQQQGALEARLAAIMNPANLDQSASQLNVIDNYLSLKNGEQVIKEALDVVKPVFLNQVKHLFQSKGMEVLQELGYDQNRNEILAFYFFSQSHPTEQGKGTFDHLLQYSHDREMFKAMEASFPQFNAAGKLKRLQQDFGQVELDRTLPLEKQAEQAMAHMEMQQKTMKDIATQRAEYLDQFEADTPKVAMEKMNPQYPELVDMATVAEAMSAAFERIEKRRYEIDNHFTNTEWLKVYADSILDYDLDLPHLLKSNDSQLQFSKVGEFARWLQKMDVSLQSNVSEIGTQVTQFMAQNDSASLNQQTIYLGVIEERNRLVSELKDVQQVKRHEIIGSAISDFNEVEVQADRIAKLRREAQSITASQSKSVQASLLDLFECKYTNFDSLLAVLRKGERLESLDHEQFIDVQRFVVEEARNLALDFAIDEISLVHAMKSFEDDQMLTSSTRASLLALLDHVSKQCKSVAHDDRKQIKLRDFLQECHYMSPQAYSLYSSKLLQKQIEKFLGATEHASAAPDVIDWQTGYSRTSPIAHQRDESTKETIDRLNLATYSGNVAEISKAHLIDEELRSLHKIVDSFDRDSINRDKEEAKKAYAEAQRTGEGLSDYDEDDLEEFRLEFKNEPDLLEMEGAAADFQQKLNRSEQKYKKDWTSANEDREFMDVISEDTGLRHVVVGTAKSTGAQTDGVAGMESQEPEGTLKFGHPIHEPSLQVHNEFGCVEEGSEAEIKHKSLIRNALSLTEFPPDMTSNRNAMENAILRMITFNNVEDQLHDIVQQYYEMRLQGCLLNPEFAARVKGDDNGHLYLKVLHERVVAELNLGKPVRLSDISYENLTSPDNTDRHYDPESAYNAQGFNNLDAIGFDNVEKRVLATKSSDNFEAGHETVFDKLLADYFLAKRGEYKESNKLMKELCQVFEQPACSQWDSGEVLSQQLLKQELGNDAQYRLAPENFRALMNLDIAVSRVMQDDRNGLSESTRALRHGDTEHPDYGKTQVPPHFHIMDVRKPAPEYVQYKLLCLVVELFQIREELEAKMTRRELAAFDKVFAKYLQHEQLMPRLVESIRRDYQLINMGRNRSVSTADGKRDVETQLMKAENEQREHNKNVLNEDALFKKMAYNMVRERQIAEIAHDPRNVIENKYDYNNFDQFYKKTLEADARKPPRLVDPAEFEPKKPWEIRDPAEKFKNRDQRELEYFDELAAYHENKKEQNERVQLYYILEQFFEEARTRPDAGSKHHTAIKNYFADPENTFFFDKNKIV